MNRAERRKMQKKLGDNLADALKEAMEKKNEIIEETQAEDLNILPMPVEQIVEDHSMAWIWIPMGGVFVVGRLFTADVNERKKGDWVVELAIPGIDTDCYALTDEAPKTIGQALISAWNYKNIWKQHAGEFLEKQLMYRENVDVNEQVEDAVIPEPPGDFEVIEIIEDPEDVVEGEVVEDFAKRPPVELNEYMKQFREPPTPTVPSFDNG